MSRPVLPVACFGKLPFWREYLDFGGTLSTSRVLKQWLHSGRAEAGLGEADQDLPPREDVEFRGHLRLLLGLGGSAELLAGVLRPSEGGGGREFPFAVFTHFARRIYGRQYSLLPLGLTAVWDELEAVWDSLASVASKAAFDEVLGSHQVPPPIPVREARTEFERMLREPASGLLDRRDGTPRVDLAHTVLRATDRISGRRGRSTVGMTLPLSADLETACFEAGLWVDLLNRQFLIRRFEPNLLLDARRDSSNRQILLRFGGLEPSDYALVSRGAWQPSRGTPTEAAGESPPSTEGWQAPAYAELLRRKFSRSKAAAVKGGSQ